MYFLITFFFLYKNKKMGEDLAPRDKENIFFFAIKRLVYYRPIFLSKSFCNRNHVLGLERYIYHDFKENKFFVIETFKYL